MNRSLSVLALLTAPVMVFGATMSITVGGATTVNATPGQTLVVDLRLSDLTIGVVGFKARLNDVGDTGKLSIVGATESDARTWGATFNTASGDMAVETSVRGALNPKSADFGCIGMSVLYEGYGPELYPSTLESVKVLVDPAATNGTTLTVGLSDLFLVAVSYVPIQVDAGPDLMITVTSGEEPDADDDGVPDRTDNCPNAPDPDQADADSEGIGDVCDSCPEDSLNDADHDGVCGDQDACSGSDLSPTIVFDGCDTGVPNQLLEGGCTMADEIVKLRASAKNHGAFVSAVAGLANRWKNEGLITGAAKDSIQSCAAKAGE